MWRYTFPVIVLVLTTSAVHVTADRLSRVESQLKQIKIFQSFVMARMDTMEIDIGTLATKVARIEFLENSTESENTGTDSPKTDHTTVHVKQSELNQVQRTLKMYKHSFAKHKKEFLAINNVIEDTLVVFRENASTTVKKLVKTVNEHVETSSDNVAMTLENISNASAESESTLRSDLLIYSKNMNAEIQKNLDTQLQAATAEMNNTMTGLIGKANKVVGIIDEKVSTFEGNIFGVISSLHGPWTDWSSWSDCSRSCETGTKTRHRSCYVPPAVADAICIGNATETEECVIYDVCPYDCEGFLKEDVSLTSGVYNITLDSGDKVSVYCDMKTKGGGWTVFQRRWSGNKENFNRSFAEYENGFGSLDGEFWLGLKIIHEMTRMKNMTLRVDVESFNGIIAWDVYTGFFISPPDRYEFHVSERIKMFYMRSILTLSHTSTNHRPFSAYDRDMDNLEKENCAHEQGGGWWYYDNCSARSSLHTRFLSYGLYVLDASQMMFRRNVLL
ncbi:fibroleukin-like [Mya arenaria]|uniref:fibroleukin-like n=1 Tax=Mya arenaria TaxID=6604 RepID=UPI0022E3DB49|nr:fibroleukin-like [Mya arenaria]